MNNYTNKIFYSIEDKQRVLSLYTNLLVQKFGFNIYVSNRYRYVFVSVRKSACSTLLHRLSLIEQDIDPSNLLIPNDVNKNAFQLKAFEHNKPLNNIMDCIDINWTLTHDPNIFRFHFVRNPYTKILSAYLHLMQSSNRSFTYRNNNDDGERNVDITMIPSRRRAMLAMGYNELDERVPKFDEFVKYIHHTHPSVLNMHWFRQVDAVSANKIIYDYIGRFEFFEDCWKELSNKLNFPKYKFEKVNVNYHKTKASNQIQKYYTQELADMIYEYYKEDFLTFDYPRKLPI